MLILAINWNRIDVARTILQSEAATSNTLMMGQAMQRALELRRAEFVEMFLELPRSDRREPPTQQISRARVPNGRHVYHLHP